MAATVVHTVLNRKNYDDWSNQIETYMLAEDLLDVLHQVRPITEDEEISRAWKKKDAKALYAIWNSCGDDTYGLIKRATTAKQAWDALSDKLKKPNEPLDENEKKSVLQAYPPPIDHATKPPLEKEEGRTEGNDIPKLFAEYVKSNDWRNVINRLRMDSEEGSATLSFVRNGTVLHYAILNFKNCSVRIIKQLVELMKREDVVITDDDDLTALHLLIRDYPEEFEIAECMVTKNARFVTNSPPLFPVPLVVEAQEKTKGEIMARTLYSRTPHKELEVPYAAQLISLGFDYNRFDIARDLIQRYPKLAMDVDCNGNIPLVTLASNRLAFKSGSRLDLWENLIYYGINRIYQMKLTHESVQQFLPLMCKASEEILTSERSLSSYKRKKLEAALCVAAERGHVEYITHFLKDSLSPVLAVRNEKGQSLFQIAAESRHHKFYKLINDLDQSKIQEIVGNKDHFGNNMLHTVASITPLSQIDHIQGTVSQMQREVQWFKEVEKVAHPKDCESENKNNTTPRKLFTENHKELAKAAEKSIKGTATSCTVVGALIVTIMFAAAFTVPGENKGTTSHPTFLTNKVFTTFIVSDVISLFSSTTSVIMFLGILTSRYSEDDFYKSLPIKMMIGLVTLFLSIATLMIVFSCGLYIMLDGKSSIVIPSILLAGVPVTSFIGMQFPLFVELYISTFGGGIFDRI
ncbi:hypothetical protein D8674_018309 [Pyrus ussuriensis x Pyrus communis]|uniref:PGG domain-containing protein n=1 Tax=Pyrus ussuriensis x Pyrus communis TaxID=2448454 RepID=A0A5N5G518_9ROSA|nr:hypothetical protein D8674_018309 [Pyrus ussuriensis x Pyrus communis]